MFFFLQNFCIFWRNMQTVATFSKFENVAECRFSSQNIRTLISIWQSAKISKYRQNIKIKFRFKIAKYRLYRRRFWRSRRHFSAFFKLYQKKTQKTPQNFRNRTKLLHQNFENFRKFAKMCCILIFWLYVVFWYFTGISYLYFEICENLQPGW